MALQRAVGATPGQVRRQMLGELAGLGALAGLLGVLPGISLAGWALRGLVAHQLMAPSPRAWTSAWLVLIAAGAGTIVAELAGFVGARRAGRTNPATALAEAHVERRLPHPVRVVLGLSALAGGIALCVVTLSQPLSAINELNLAFGMGLSFMAAIALLGPILVVVSECALRIPTLACSGVGGRLALAELRGRPRRAATAVTAIALAVAFIGTVYFVDATEVHADTTQAGQRLTAQAVVTAPAPGLAPTALTSISHRPGVQAAVGLEPTTVFTPDPGNEKRPRSDGRGRLARSCPTIQSCG